MTVKILTQKEKGMNRHWKNFVDKDYLGAHNLEPGEEMLLTIERFEGEEEVATGEGKKVKQVLYFKENVPKMILNVTNANMIASFYGSHPDQWVGKQIQLHSASVKAFGKTQDALRIRDFVPKREVDSKKYIAKLESLTDLEELKKYWQRLPQSVRDVKEIEDVKDLIKNKLS